MKRELALGLKMGLLDQQQGGALVLQASSGLNPLAGKVALKSPGGQHIALLTQGFLRSANKVEFQGRKYK